MFDDLDWRDAASGEVLKTRESGFFFAYEAIPATDNRTFCNGQVNDFALKPRGI
jgi:hypothetical protein